MKHIRKQNGGTLQWDMDDWTAGLGPQGSFSSTSFTALARSQSLNVISNNPPGLNLV